MRKAGSYIRNGMQNEFVAFGALCYAGFMTEGSVSTAQGDQAATRPDDAGGPRLPLTQRVAGAIRDMIVQDQLKPGERIRERALSEVLKVSRTPLREALKLLSAEGLVEILPHRGAVVANPEPQEIYGKLQVLGVLESLAGELAAVQATDEEISEVRALHFEMLASYTRKNRLEYFKANQKIHRAILSCSRNEALIETHSRINAQLYRVRYQSNLRNRKWQSAIEEHEDILHALEARDSGRLSALLRAHLGSTWAKVSEMLGVSGSE